MRFRLSRRPVQDDISCRHYLNFLRARIDRVAARVEGIYPDALFPTLYEVAVLECLPRDILPFLADVGDYDTDVGNRNLCKPYGFNRREVRVDEVLPGKQH